MIVIYIELIILGMMGIGWFIFISRENRKHKQQNTISNAGMIRYLEHCRDQNKKRLDMMNEFTEEGKEREAKREKIKSMNMGIVSQELRKQWEDEDDRVRTAYRFALMWFS